MERSLAEKCLSDMREILVKNKQPFFLTCGTLLGQYRNNDFISYDNDIDIGILQNTFNENLVSIILNSNKFILYKHYGNITNSLELTFKHKKNKIKIDIFLYYPLNIDDSYYYSATFNGICDLKEEKFCKWGNHIRGFTKVIFNKNTYSIPTNTDEFLTECYGDWRTPKKFDYTEGLAGEYKNLLN